MIPPEQLAREIPSRERTGFDFSDTPDWVTLDNDNTWHDYLNKSAKQTETTE